ncbi:hypothetical protein MPC4_60094 [Methylocella tundrae]|uniref:Uncharacterized protein n=1 Tax=Methylocella tundrae TaxID=227605 RepID=A0A8B6MBT3_METTU|nr:hypothetical protein MPC4_60094 [Methylocella tundrae]
MSLIPARVIRGVSEPLQAKHRAQATFDRSMIRFNEVIQVFRQNFGPRALMLFEPFTRRSMRSLIAVERDLLRQSTLALERPTENGLAAATSRLAEQEIDGHSSPVDGAIEVGPATFDLDVGLINAPAFVGLASEKAVPPLSNSGTARWIQRKFVV